MEEEKLIDMFKKSKKDLESTRNKINEYIQKNTKKEIEELEKAYQNYYNKIDSIQNTDKYKQLTNEEEKRSTKLKKNLQTVIKVFDSKKEEIMSGGGTDKDKGDKINRMYDYMLNKLFDEEEIKMFKALRGKIIYMLE